MRATAPSGAATRIQPVGSASDAPATSRMTAQAAGVHRVSTCRTTCRRGAGATFTISAAASADRKSTRLNSSHSQISYAVFCLKKKNNTHIGEALTIVVFDILRRYLLSTNHHVEFIHKFTDYDDDIRNRSVEERSTAEQLASSY